MDAADISELNERLTNLVVASRLRITQATTAPITLAEVLLSILRQHSFVESATKTHDLSAGSKITFTVLCSPTCNLADKMMGRA